MSDDAEGTFGFTWGETEGLVWLRDDDGNYKRVDRELLADLRAVAAGERRVADLSEKKRAAVDHLREADFLHSGGSVTRHETPPGVTLWPRLLAFGVAFALLTAYVGYRILITGMPVGTGTVPSLGGGVVADLLLAVPVFVALALVHEAGHYFAARPYFRPSLDLTLLNGVFPAFVTRTNDAWRCPRSVRVWINLAGPFLDCLQCLVLAALSLFVFPASYLLAVLPIFEYVRLLFSLNPFVRGDGYWMLVDWFGATNLHTRGVRDLKNLEPSVGALYATLSTAVTLFGLVMMGYVAATLAGLV